MAQAASGDLGCGTQGRGGMVGDALFGDALLFDKCAMMPFTAGQDVLVLTAA